MIPVESVFSPSFRPYGKVAVGYDLTDFLAALRQTPCPKAGTVYRPAEESLERLPAARALQQRFYGGMPIQVGYCNGSNGTLNCLEYHRDSEINIFADDAVLLVAKEWEIEDGQLDTGCVKAFLAPAGSAVELYATTLHYAPCAPEKGGQFRVSIVLPRGTNTEKPPVEPDGQGSGSGDVTPHSAEDALLWAKNKWLLAHPTAPEAAQGAYVGLQGENITLW